MVLCDGDCGNCYEEKHMNATVYGQNMCRECMFTFMAEQEHRELPPENEEH